jgi:hypothetical protein
MLDHFRNKYFFWLTFYPEGYFHCERCDTKIYVIEDGKLKGNTEEEKQEKMRKQIREFTENHKGCLELITQEES